MANRLRRKKRPDEIWGGSPYAQPEGMTQPITKTVEFSPQQTQSNALQSAFQREAAPITGYQPYTPQLGPQGQYIPDYSTPEGLNYFANRLADVYRSMPPINGRRLSEPEIMQRALRDLMKNPRFTALGSFPMRITPNKAWWGIPGNVPTPEGGA